MRRVWVVFWVILGFLILLLGPAHFIQTQRAATKAAQAEAERNALQWQPK